MSDMSKKPAPSYAPVYAAALYPGLAEIAQRFGYALCVHGSLQHDLDLLAVAWAEIVHPPQAVIDEILRRYAVEQTGAPNVYCGRLRFNLAIAFGECRIDLQFMRPSEDWARGQIMPDSPIRDGAS